MLTPFFKPFQFPKLFPLFNNLTLKSIFLLTLFFHPSFAQTISHKEKATTFISLHTSKDQKWLQEFCEEIFISNAGIYTLYGSKPITEGSIYYITEEEATRRINELIDLADENEKEELKKSIVYIDYTFNNSWDEWKKQSPGLDLDSFLFAEWPTSDPCEKQWLFVNIKETSFILQKYYTFFKDCYGKDFSPLEIVYEIQNENSIFWNAVFKHHGLRGLLHGFGEHNSWMFHLNTSSEERGEEGSIFKWVIVPQENFKGHHIFPLPPFASFSYKMHDETVENFKEDRDILESFFRDKNFQSTCIEALLQGGIRPLSDSYKKSLNERESE
jgi:hypothetical protein